ncbi:MAG: MaoC family dehydratase [SAR202 cluster bacterium]|jgi:acyl dehydratase|nr:MaoC family dehydratase [SAR202 cluster bacterium]
MDITVGQKASREITVTEEMVQTFARLTGDYNPLHFDAEFTARTRFKRLIVQGGITTGLLNALVAMDMPGPGSVFVSQDWRFPRPVYIGDTIRAEATVLSIDEPKPVADIGFVIRNQDREEVLQGRATVYQARPR